MKRLFLVIACVAVCGVGPAFAASNFAAYEGKNAVTEGQGGTKVTKDGVDFWTTGAPPHRYQVLGVMTDKRGTGLFSGNAVGDSGLAAKVKALGGDAVIMQGQDTQVSGAMVSGGNVLVARRATTQLLVVKYLDATP